MCWRVFEVRERRASSCVCACVCTRARGKPIRWQPINCRSILPHILYKTMLKGRRGWEFIIKIYRTGTRFFFFHRAWLPLKTSIPHNWETSSSWSTCLSATWLNSSSLVAVINIYINCYHRCVDVLVFFFREADMSPHWLLFIVKQMQGFQRRWCHQHNTGYLKHPCRNMYAIWKCVY